MSGLFGISSDAPSDPSVAFAMLKPHGEDIYGYAEGWGIAIFDGKAARLFKEKRAFARTSYLSPFDGEAFQSALAIAHINKAVRARDPLTVADIQPFERELGGRSWVFAHDGNLPEQFPSETDGCMPIGSNPSEWAFCGLLTSAVSASEKGNGATDQEHLIGALSRQISRTNELGVFNILMSEGEYLFVHAHTVLYQLQRRASEDKASSAVSLISSYPLTDDDGWKPLPSNSLTIFRAGQQIGQTETQGKASSEAWKRQRREADLVKRRRFEIEQWARGHSEQFGDGMNYDSG
jgi:predicted glutamine amidotransferase